MNIAIIGYGKMGHIVESIALDRGHTITATIDPAAEDATHREIDKGSVKDADVCIEFSLPATVMENLQKVSSCKKNLVLATTGWYDQVDKARAIVQRSGIGFLYASNFSIGVNVFFRIVEDAARIIDKIDSYDIYGFEMHHKRKKDSPSGTAKSIEKILLDNISRKKKVVEEKLDRQVRPDELHFASLRCGDFPGTHIVGFDSDADTIELKHTARTRKGFALGAVMAAEWLKDRKGFFTIDSMMKEIMGDKDV